LTKIIRSIFTCTNSPSLYVTGLPEYADVANVTERFKKFGPVKDVDFPVADKPFCFVHFESQAGVDKAMATEDDDDFFWDEYELYFEPKRARPLPQGGSSSGSATGKGQPTTSNYKPVTNKNNETKTHKGQQPTNNQDQQEPTEEGTWKKVEYRSTRRKEEKAEKKGDKAGNK